MATQGYTWLHKAIHRDTWLAIHGYTRVHGYTRIHGYTQVHGYTRVLGYARLYTDIHGYKIANDRKVWKNLTNLICSTAPREQ